MSSARTSKPWTMSVIVARRRWRRGSSTRCAARRTRTPRGSAATARSAGNQRHQQTVPPDVDREAGHELVAAEVAPGQHHRPGQTREPARSQHGGHAVVRLGHAGALGGPRAAPEHPQAEPPHREVSPRPTSTAAAEADAPPRWGCRCRRVTRGRRAPSSSSSLMVAVAATFGRRQEQRPCSSVPSPTSVGRDRRHEQRGEHLGHAARYRSTPAIPAQAAPPRMPPTSTADEHDGPGPRRRDPT